MDSLRAILSLIHENETITFKEISDRTNIAYKNIYRLFVRHLGLNPIQFRRIIKFRMALKKGIDPAYKSKMSKVALESGYFDQAHYINEFKKISTLTPKGFVSSVWIDDCKKIA